MATIEELQKEIEKIKERNARVEADKAWELSWARKILIFVLTYLVIVSFFYFARLPDPFANAVVPATAFVISTLAIGPIKGFWIAHFYTRIHKK